MVKFFKVSGKGSYYSALLKAETKEEAIKFYQTLVCEVDSVEELTNEMKEYNLADAVKELQKSQKEDGTLLSDSEVLEQLIDDDLVLLTVDSSLM